MPWNRWFLDHRAPLNRIRIADALDDGEISHPIYTGLWYFFKIEARVRRVAAAAYLTFMEERLVQRTERLNSLAMEVRIAVNKRQIESVAGVDTRSL